MNKTDQREKNSALLWIVVLFVAFNPLAIYRLDFGSGMKLSIDRSLFFIGTGLFMAAILIRYKIKRHGFLFFALIWINLVSVIIGATPLFVPSEFIQSKLSMLILNFAIFYLVFDICRNNEKALRYVLYSFLAVGLLYIIFSIYTLYSFFFLGKPPTDIPFREYIPFKIADPGHIAEAEKFRLGDLTRLTLPFGTPPHLSMAASITALMLFNLVATIQGAFKKNMVKLIIIVLFGVTLFSGSRSGILSLIIGLFVFSLLYWKHFGVSKLKILFAILGLMLLLLTLLAGLVEVNLGPLQFVINRFMEASSTGHLSVRLTTLESFINYPFYKVLIGSGIGSFPYLLGISSGHMTYGTLLVERGLLGLSSFVFIFMYIGLYLIKIPIKKIHKSHKIWVITTISCLCLIMVGNLFYEFYYITPMWVALGWCAAFSTSHMHRFQ